MWRCGIIKIAVALCFLSATPFANADTDVERPNALSFELLGRGLLFSINYDRALNESIALGVGFTSWGASATSSDGTNYASTNVIIVPLYLNYYFYNPGSSRWFLTGGIDFLNASFAVDGFKSSGTSAAFVGGIGYEFRSESGFLLRTNLYVLSGGGAAIVWPGLSLGYTF